jgi:dUTP pyrophosphatase
MSNTPTEPAQEEGEIVDVSAIIGESAEEEVAVRELSPSEEDTAEWLSKMTGISEEIVGSFAVLKLAIESDDPELLELYAGHIAKHNASLDTTDFPNSGFDLFVPQRTVFPKERLFRTQMVDLQVKTEMTYWKTSDENGVEEVISSPFVMYPRSSMSKTPLMLANHVGIIDCGYRGNLMAAVRCLYPADSGEDYAVEKYTRLFQICHPTLCPVFVVLVKASDLSSTERGDGGFGSTGVQGVQGSM